ncbi:hypothetical protein ACFL6S_27170 [Candidatus Poribacteria bacterium]
MKYCCIIIVCIFILSSYAFGDEAYTIQFQISKPYCLLNFMETLRTNGYFGPTLFGYYKESKFNDDENLKNIVSQYRNLGINYSYEFGGYPKYRFMSKGRSARDLLYILSAKSKTLSEFKQITIGIIPYYQHRELFEVFETVEPIYDKLIWDKYYSVAEQRLHEIEEYARQVNLSEKLKSVASFFNNGWPADIPIIYTFSIVPGDKIRLIPPPQGNAVFSGILTEKVDNYEYIGRVVHEFSHRSFAEQPLELHQQIDQWMMDSESPHKYMVSLMFNEVLGGAVGHKLNEDLIGEHEFTYGQSFIKEYDEAIYPLVVSYMNEGKSIDRSFVEQSLKIYEETFPNTLNNYSSLFQTYYLLTDAENYRELPGLIMKHISRPMMYERGMPIVNDENIDKLISYDFAKLLVITKDNESTFNYLSDKIAALKKFSELDLESDFILSFHGADGKAYIIMNLHSIESFEPALKVLKEQKEFSPENPVTQLD